MKIFKKIEVLQSDNSIKHGSYIKLGRYTKDTIETGYYNNNLRDGIWIFYNSLDSKIEKKGHYKNDSIIGIWEFYDYKGELEQKFNYNSNTIVYSKKNIDKDTTKQLFFYY